MKYIYILLVLTTLLSCRTKTVTYSNNTITADSISTLINDCVSISNNKNEVNNIVENISTITDEDITEVITDSINNIRVERTIKRTTRQTTGKTTEETITEQNDTTIITNEITQQKRNNEVTEHLTEKTSNRNVMLWFFLCLVAVIALILVIKLL